MLRPTPVSAQGSTLPIITQDARTRSPNTNEAAQINETYLWLLVMAATAECITTCFVPEWQLYGWRINASATILNWIGPFLDGLTYGYEDISKTSGVTVACWQFRSAFLGVFTSYSFMVDHAGDLSSSSFLMGPMYICVSVLGACMSFHLGKIMVQPAMATSVIGYAIRFLSSKKKLTLWKCMLWFIGMTTFIAAFGPRGFVRDPKDPQFIGALQVADGEELFLGIFMSCSAILVSDYISEHFKPPADRRSSIPFIDWGCLLCNFLSCLLVCCAYGASKLSPGAVKHNLLILKFVSSFCGSLSCFSASISHIMRLWQTVNYSGALWNLLLHLIVALLFVPYLNKQEST